jgi:hypothetical protein
MSIENAIYTMLNGHAGLSALVGVRIYPMYLPQTPTLPACAYRLTSAQTISLLATDTNIIEARYEIAVFSKTYDQCVATADQLRQALQRQSGTVETVVILDITIDNIDQSFDQDFEIYEITTDVTISYRT